MTGFEADIRAQGVLLHALFTVNRQDELMEAAAGLASPGRPIVFTGMGSSLAAARPAAIRLSTAGMWATVTEAGELLHYEAEGLLPGTLVVLVSQSGQSAETVRVGRRLRAVDGVRLVAVVNDPGSPLAELADVVLPVHAGAEVTVSTKTFIATLLAVHALADALLGASGQTIDTAIQLDLASRVGELASQPQIARPCASRFSGVHALLVIGRGPAYVAAEYGALILKEAAAIPAEAMFGASFRHGPIEVTGPTTGIVVLAPPGPTQSLCRRLATDTARLGSPTWLLTTHNSATDGGDDRLSPDGLLTSDLAVVPEVFAPLLYSVPLQHLAVQLAEMRDRQPGVVERSNKVTASE